MSNLMSLAAFLLLILIIWIIDHKKIKREGPLFYLRRTKRGIETIDYFGKKYSSFLKAFGSLGIIFAFGLPGLFYYFKGIRRDVGISKSRIILCVILYCFVAVGFICLLNNALFMPIVEHFNLVYYGNIFVYLLWAVTFVFGLSGYVFFTLFYGVLSIFLGKTTESSLQLVLPVEIPESSNLPIVSVPLFVWIVAILVILLVHELAHAVVSSAIGVKVKSIGYGFFAILPLGFAEPDEKELSKVSSLDCSRVYSAGYFNNIFSAIFMLGILMVALLSVGLVGKIYGDIYDYRGVAYSVMADDNETVFPSSVLPESGVITGIDGKPVLKFDMFVDSMTYVRPGQEVILVVNGTNYSITTVAHPDNVSMAYIGVYVNDYVVLKDEFEGSLVVLYLDGIKSFLELMVWLILLSVGIAFFNILPIRGLDGGKIAEEIFIAFCGKNSGKKMASNLTKVTLLLIFLSLFGTYLVSVVGYLL